MRGLILHFSSSRSCSLENREPWFLCVFFFFGGCGGGSNGWRGLNESVWNGKATGDPLSTVLQM